MSTTSTTDSLIERHREEIDTEIEKLRPQAEEYERLVSYRESLGGAIPRKRASRASRSGASTGGGGGGGGGSRSDANRPQQFLDALKDNPGATIPAIAKVIGDVSANYLYRVRDTLVDEGKVRKEGQQHFMVDGDEAPAKAGKAGASA